MSAEELSVHADLFAHEGGFTPRPAWQVIEAARRQMLTGELSLATTPTTHVYLRDGQVYFAERTTDGGLGVRLLVEGVITRQQMGKGALLVSGVEHLGRMFQRDPSIDRMPVELAVELMTDDVLTSVANDVIDHYTMTMYKRHPNGIDRWLPTRIDVITHIVENSRLAEPDAEITPGPGPRTRNAVVQPTAPVADVEEVVVEPVAAMVVEEIVAATVVADVVVIEEPIVRDTVVQDTVVEAVVDVAVDEVLAAEPEPVFEMPVFEMPVFEEPVAAEHAITEELAIVEPEYVDDITAALALAAMYSEVHEPQVAESPAEAAPDNGSGISLAQSAVDAIMSSTIADEVADAVRRALSAIDAAAQPLPKISPEDFAATVPTPVDAATSAV